MAGSLKFPEELCIANVEDVVEKMLAALGSGADVTFDLTDVGRIDTAGVQALAAARKEAECAGTHLELKLSDTVSLFAARIGLIL